MNATVARALQMHRSIDTATDARRVSGRRLKRMSSVRRRRISYWAGALADAGAAVLMLVPAGGLALYGVEGYEPTIAYTYAMRLGASLMVGWTVLFLYSYARSRDAADEAALPEGQVSLEEAASEFLAQSRFAVAGVSRSGDAAANYIFKRLLETGREAYATNPNAEDVEGERCYASLADLPQPVDAAVIATHPDQSIDVARQCKAAGVRYVWFHRSVDRGSYSRGAIELCAEYGATVIPGGCPMMHLDPVDVPHRCMYVVLNKLGALPRGVDPPNA